jgi:uncharacterized protein with HEPN domain
MRLESLKYLYDIEQAASLLTRFSSGKSLAEYQADALLRSGIERQFIIIGEALSRFIKLEPELGLTITGHRQIIDFRNILVHGYDVVRDDRVWDIVEHHLPVLIEEAAALKKRGDEENPPES